MKQNVKQWFGILLSLTLMLGLIVGLSATAYADDEEPHVHGTGSEAITFQPWTSTTSLPTTEGNYVLDNDVTISSTWTVPSGTTNLCLDGHIITKTASPQGRVINVMTGATLNLFDKADNSGKITGGHAGDNGGGVLVQGGTFVMNGGTITENTIDSQTGNWANCGGGVALVSGAFTMNGGVISKNVGGNYWSGSYQYHKGGGGVGVIGGSFTMNGGEIVGNRAYNGGGLYMHNQITPVINGGEIHDNTASASGGAIYAIGQVNLYVKGGIIYNNSAPTGGGIWLTWRTISGVKRGATVHISSGEMYGNHSNGLNGAIGCNTNASFYLSGNPSFHDNTYGTNNTVCNIYLASGTIIRLEGSLEESAFIGVTTATKRKRSMIHV